MSFRFVNLMCTLACMFACGPKVVDAGTLPETPDGNGDTGAPDAGSEVVPDTTAPKGCTIPDLGRYRLVFDSDGGNLERRIYSMRADGTELEALTPPGEIAREPALSPDGKYLAYSALEGIRKLSLATGESELIVPGGDQPSWSADGQRIFYRDGGGWPSGILTFTLEDGSTGGIGNSWPVSNPSISSDGSTVVVSISSEGGDSPFAFGVQAFHQPEYYPSWYPVPMTQVRVTQPTISPDNVWLGAAIQCQNEQWSSLWVSPLAVSTLPCEGHRITPPGAPSVSNPKWGPANLIAYERATPPRDIAIVSADTGEECVIQGPGDDRNPSWMAPADFPSPQ